MPKNKNFSARIELLNALFRTRPYSLEELMSRLSNQIGSISKKSVQNDIQAMRLKGAPIKCKNGRYVYDPIHYHIHQLSPPPQALEKLRETITLLHTLPGLGITEELEDLYRAISFRATDEENERAAVVHFDFRPGYTGKEHLADLYDAIMHQTAVKFKYKPFTASESSEVHFFPYCLKEYNGRWFAIGMEEESGLIRHYGLERIQSNISPLKKTEWRSLPGFSPTDYFSKIVGVTLTEGRSVEKVVLKIRKPRAFYILTNPWHHTLHLIKESRTWMQIGLDVIVNKELESLILSLGEDAEVLSPTDLRKSIAELLQRSLANY